MIADNDRDQWTRRMQCTRSIVNDKSRLNNDNNENDVKDRI